jgi:ATP-dependent RNA helicase SUPV3L1/SUV3
MAHIERIANNLHTRQIAEILLHYQERVQFEHALFELAPLNAQIQQALLVDKFAPELGLKDKYIFVCAPISLNVPFERDDYLLCLKSVAQSQIRHLPIRPNWLETHSPKHLEQAELLSHNLSLYAWLSFKFPQYFVDGDHVRELRQAVSRYIERALLTQAGYGNTHREVDLLMTRAR